MEKNVKIKWRLPKGVSDGHRYVTELVSEETADFIKGVSIITIVNGEPNLYEINKMEFEIEYEQPNKESVS